MSTQNAEESGMGENQSDVKPLSTTSPGQAGPSESTTDNTTNDSAVGESSSKASTESPPTCTNCLKPQESPAKLLKPCSKCQSVSYCSRDCTKAHFKVHKKVCAKLAQEYFSNADLKMESSSSRTMKEGRRGGLQKWQFDT